MTASNYASSYVQIFPAMKTGPRAGARQRDGARAHHRRSGKVTAVSYIDKTDGSEKQVRCRTVVLSASACESARLLLNSKSSRHPQGLANSSGMVGRYLMDTVGSSMSATVPALSGMPHYNSDGYGVAPLRAVVGLGQHKELGFPRGYHIEVGGGYGMPGVGSFTGIVNRTEGYGVKMKQAIRDEYGTSIGLAGRGEMIPNEKSFCEIDPDGEGSLGHPGAALPLGVERPRAEPGPPHAADVPLDISRGQWADRSLTGGGRGGGAGQTTDPTSAGRSAADFARRRHHPRGRHGAHGRRPEDERAQQVPARRTTSRTCSSPTAAPFVSNPDKNPTHTIVALAWRTAEYLAEEMRKGNV